jgi:hypothetical protein
MVKTTKPRAPRKTPLKRESRAFPKYQQGMSTIEYVQAYHRANAGVHLTMVDYQGVKA